MSRVIKSNLALRLTIPSSEGSLKRKEISESQSDDLYMEVRHGELFVILGAPRSGKSDILRTIAGFSNIGIAKVHLYGEDIRYRKPTERPVNLVFPTPALFPHLTVAENIGFGLEQLRRPSSEIRQVVGNLLTSADMHDLALKQPHQLNDSEKQLTSILRGIAPSPRLLLLDEPFQLLDYVSKQKIRRLLRRLQAESEMTLIVATQDRDFALGSADYIAAIVDGKLVQSGTPEDIYCRPLDERVARLSGDINSFPVNILSVQGNVAFCKLASDQIITLHNPPDSLALGESTLLSRPEQISITSLNPDIDGVIELIEFQGSQCFLTVNCPQIGKVRVAVSRVLSHKNYSAGQSVGLKFQNDFLSAQGSGRHDKTA